MAVEPLIIAGDPTLNIPPDTLRVAYTKYNSHNHNIATSDSFKYYPIQVGDIISIYSNGSLISQPNTQVLRINNSEVEISTISQNITKISNAVLVIGEIEIANIEIQAISNLLTLVPTSGFVSNFDLARLKTYTQTILLNNYNLGSSFILVPPELFSFFRISRVFVYSNGTGITSAKLQVVNSSLAVDEEVTINLVSQKGLLTVNEYNLTTNLSFQNRGLQILPVGTSNSPLSITVELLVP